MSDTTATPPRAGAPARTLRNWWLVGATALPMAAWLVHIAAMPALVPLACDTGASWPMHLLTAVTALAALAGVLAIHRTRYEVARQRDERDSTGEEPLEDPGAELLERARSWGTWGVVTGWLFVVLILAEHVPVLALSPCPP